MAIPGHVDLEVTPTPEQALEELAEPEQPQPEEGDQEFSTAEEAAELIKQYWAADEDTEALWKVLDAKAEEYHEALNRRGFYAVSRLMYAMFYGMTPATSGYDYNSQTVSFTGEDGEQVELNINEIRSFADQIVTMVTKTRPAFQAVATNTDYQTLSQVTSADTVIQYYYASAYNEMKERATVDREVRYGKSFTHIQWNSDGGRKIEVPQPPVPSPSGPLPAGKPVEEKTGDIRVTSKYYWDVVCEPYRSEKDEHIWRLVREDDIDKWEAMARYPVYAKKIHDSRNPGDRWESFKPGWDPSAKTSPDACQVNVFYHAPTAALPNGRRVVFVNCVAVDDDDLPIDEIPLYPLMSCEMDRTCFGVTDLSNLIPAEQMMNAALSDMATNIDAFGRPPLAMTEGTDIDVDSLANGQTILFLPPNAQMPEAVKFPAIPEVTPRMIEMMRMFKMSAVGTNQVQRGDTSSDITSGAHAALYTQTAIENQSPRVLDLDLHRERVANGMLKLLKKYGKHPQLVAIAGVDEKPYMDEFTQDQWSSIQRVTMKVISPALRTVAGRLQVVEMLRDWPGQPLKDPQRIIDLVTTGQMKSLIDPMRVMELAARWENEQLLQGPATQQIPTGEIDPMTGLPQMQEVVPNVRALFTDNLATHLISHFEVLYSPAARNNPAIKAAVMAHIQEHVQVARMSDPMVSQIVGNPAPDTGMQPQDTGADGSGPSDKDVKGAQSATKDPGVDDSKGASMPTPAEPPAGAGL